MIRKPILFCLAFLGFLSLLMGPPAVIRAAEGAVSGRFPTEQEVATEKFLAKLESALAKKFFHYRNRPIIRVAVFDFTDGSGNVVRSGRELAERISRRLYLQNQFDVVSQEKINKYLRWNGLTSLGRLNADGLYRLQRRINIMDPGNGIHTLITGEVQKGAARSIQASVSLINFQYRIGNVELEHNRIDELAFTAEIPLPTDQALQEASEVVLRAEKQVLDEGRLLILANTRGSDLQPTDYSSQFSKEQPFPWGAVPSVLTKGKADVSKPGQIILGLSRVHLTPIRVARGSLKYMEYSFLHGKFATNEIYFDEIIPAQKLPLLASVVDLKLGELLSEIKDVQVYPGATTVVVLSIYVPSEKERIRSKQVPRIQIFNFEGKGTEVLPGG